MKAERWDEKHWDDTDHERTGRGKDTVMLMLNHAQNHLWREVWPASPRDRARGLYWWKVRAQVHALHHGGGGGMQAAAEFGGQTQYTTRRTRLSQYLAACGVVYGRGGAQLS